MQTTANKGEVAVAFIDGGSRGNPGPSASAFSLSVGGAHVVTKGAFIGTRTNNEAEYMALAFLLDYVYERKVGGELHIYSDSILCVNQMTRRWATKDRKIASIQAEIFGKVKWLMPSLAMTLNHIPRECNVEADKAVNKVLDAVSSGLLRGEDAITWTRPVSCAPAAWGSEILGKLVYTHIGGVLAPAGKFMSRFGR